MFFDNEDVYKSASTTESTLKKKNVIICYHNYREAVAVRLAWIDKEVVDTNLADLITKMLFQIRRESLLDKFTQWFILEVVLYERLGSGFLPKKGFITSSL